MSDGFFLTQWIFLGLRWLFEDITNGNIVITVIIFTIFIRGLTIFGDIQSRKSSQKMQAIQPDLERIKKKYANNPQKLQQAQSKLMKERGVSMFGGCLPMLITMPLFICFFSAFRHWGYEQMVRVLFELENTGTSATFPTFNFLWIHNIWQPDSGLKPIVMAAEDFLKTPGLQKLIYFNENPAAREMCERLGFFVADVKNIPQIAVDNYNTLVKPLVDANAGYTNGWFIMPILAAATSYLSGLITQKGQPKQDPNAAGAGMSKSMLYMMPAMSFFFCLTYNAAFAVYWTISNVVSLITNIFINKKFKKDEAAEEVL